MDRRRGPTVTAAAKQTAQRESTRKRAPKTAQIERTVKTVLDATVELLVEIGYRNITVARISERSGVARSTIYRHWKSVPELAIDAFNAALGPVADAPDLGDVRTNLIFHYDRFAKALKNSIRGKLMPSLLEAAQNDRGFDALFEKLVDRRSDSTREILRRAIERGELRPDTEVEWVIDLLGGRGQRHGR